MSFFTRKRREPPRPRPKLPKHLVLTTFPEHKSANVGDALIAQSFTALVRHLGLVDETEERFRADPSMPDVLGEFGSLPIFLPGMSVSNNFYPALYTLHPDFDRIPKGLIPFGCTWQHPIGFPEHFERSVLEGDSLRLLKQIADTTGPIATRDHSAELILARNGVPAMTVGDCAWYHLPSHGKPMRSTRTIKRVAVTTPHHVPLTQQSIALVASVRELYPSAEINLVTHSKISIHNKQIIAAAAEFDVSAIAAAGDLSIFEKYEDYDLHVGHRLHGHIGFLRRRIPSVLIMEDARSRGFGSSIPVGCFPGFRPASSVDEVEADPNTVARVAEFLRQETRDGFMRYVGVAPYLDRMLDDLVLPQLRLKYELATRALARATS